MRSPQRLRRGAHAAPRRAGRHRAPGSAVPAPVRLAALTAVAGATVGAALIGQPASAQSGSSVEFAGSCGIAGLGLLGGNAVSNPGQLSVPAGAEVAFLNQFDRPATLRVDGAATALVGPGDAAAIAFEHGPATVTMQIDCPVGGKTASATVEVVGADRPASPLMPGPSTGTAPPAGSATAPAGPAPTRPGRSDQPGAGSPGSGQPGSEAGGWQAFAAPPVPGQGQPGAAERERRDAAGAAKPADEDLGARWRDQGEGGAPYGGTDSVDQQTEDDIVVTDRLASTADSPAGNGPIGLLALVATICVVGVSAGAVRAIIAQRARVGVA